ncbi:CAAX amino terminal protease self- immunity [Weeksella virosa]|uniref:CPBP family intramembrane glutamic endopeptidase n=1 Tax=Weeksella virosa TaxID=1014 RepID=UPI000E062379|nr:CPBP family intramembrane glutamic endopeptidase [Weeksella virosa]SUP53319.1 CAAX amino terminal protease self- immunity [Weeksella virosa]
MNQLVNEIISTTIQVILSTLIPFIFFLFRKDKNVTFFNYIGLFKPTTKSISYVLLASILFLIGGLGMIFLDESIKQAVFSPPSVTGILRTIGLSGISIIILLIVAIFKTALAEEILFRGFIAKQLTNKFGFKTGNLIQATIFGVIHLLLFWTLTKTALIFLLFSFLFSFVAGWTIGYIKEKYANGSIIPGWIAHAIGNTLSYTIIAFVI